MKRLVSILLLTCITYQVSYKMGVIAWFGLNQESIVAFFCINKDKPEMECDGKCYLNKKLSEANASSTSQNSAPVQDKKEIQEVLFFEIHPYQCDDFLNGFLVFNTQASGFSIFIISRIFHPPKRLVA